MYKLIRVSYDMAVSSNFHLTTQRSASLPTLFWFKYTTQIKLTLRRSNFVQSIFFRSFVYHTIFFFTRKIYTARLSFWKKPFEPDPCMDVGRTLRRKKIYFSLVFIEYITWNAAWCFPMKRENQIQPNKYQRVVDAGNLEKVSVIKRNVLIL